jgi:predicted ester cyclase
MNEDGNKEVARRFVTELWNQRRLEVADGLIARDGVTHQLRTGEGPEGASRSPEDVRREVAAWRAGFPDLQIAIEQVVAAGDRVAVPVTPRGTNTGSWMGLAPTGRKVVVPMFVIQRMVGGKIAEDWVLVGSLSLLQQLGLVDPASEIISKAAR